MKKSKAAIIIAICAIALVAMCVIGYITLTGQGVPANTNESVSLYFLDSTKTKLVSETADVKPSDDITMLEDIVRLLIQGPKDSVEKKRAIPQETELLSISVDGSIATVDFSGTFYGATDLDNSLAAATVVKTLCETGMVSKVKILVEGMELIGSDKIPLGALGSDDIVYDGSQTKNSNINVSLYFADKTGQYLQVEQRSVSQNDKEPIEKIVINELLNGSMADGLKLIPAEAKLLSTETKDGVCFVNFSKDFVEKRTAGSSAELMTIYSVVNTLTDLQPIDKVQFLIEGQKVETFGEMVFDEPFTKNTSLMRQPDASADAVSE